MTRSMAAASAALALLASGSATAADICKAAMAHGPISYCATEVFSSGLKGALNVQLGPGTALSGTGIPGTNTAGDVITGAFDCPGDNFFSATDTSNQGDNNTIYGRFSTTRPASAHGFDSFNSLVFSLELSPGACQAPPVRGQHASAAR